ncbi:glycerophosphoryl diester phosphodiesterase [Ardenticatena maritima]|uniref:Glycerophosphoryl diester phosphodiesterase n=1 Tax=Ardenticatena maritima TaxID=872965 RepID=A0A0M8KAQ0_9CHLR|nr:glycerophosphodiester phosphodiesterase family protein [Ardenticatena maritima]KPL87263.1 hypothetical protein SE16_12235 [Ardenticatena maritima]GAP64351.1 glycerophosphoryl diester phosphodiesterase [Ardenticatena maritima]
MKRPLILAHRGAQRVAPENTLPAFLAAIAQGADGIELDVQRTADGVLVVAHDENLGRTISGTPSERVARLTWAELQQRDAGGWFGETWRGTPPPSLDDVFDALPDTVFVNIELKRTTWASDGLEKTALHFLQRRNLWHRVIVSSFNPTVLARLRLAAPHLKVGLLYAPDLPLPLRRAWARHLLQPAALHPHLSQVTPEMVARAHRRGQQVNVWTVNDPGEIRRMAMLGVDAIITDVPDVAKAVLEEAHTS